MRLIDADKLKLCYTGTNGLDDKAEYFSIRKMIDSQPTAYDVDRVVERLERDSQNIELIYPTDQGYDYEDAVGIDINKAKEIVKSGGIE